MNHLVVMSGSLHPHHGGVSEGWVEESGLPSLPLLEEESAFLPPLIFQDRLVNNNNLNEIYSLKT